MITHVTKDRPAEPTAKNFPGLSDDTCPANPFDISTKHHHLNILYTVRPPIFSVCHLLPRYLSYMDNLLAVQRLAMLWCCAPGLLTSNAPSLSALLSPNISSTRLFFANGSLGRSLSVTSTPFRGRPTHSTIAKSYRHPPIWVSRFRSCSISSGERKRCES